MTGTDVLQRWRFGLLLLAILCTLAIEPIVPRLIFRSWISDAFYSLVLLAAVYAITPRRRHRAWIVVFGGVTLLATWAYHVMPDSWNLPAMLFHHLAGIVFLLFVVIETLRGVFVTGKFTVDNLLGTLAGYMLLGMAWSSVYSLVHLLSPHAFSFSDSLAPYLDDAHARFTVFVYYSFITLTTLGFGDIVPLSPAARTLSWLEAVAGQFYIATLVAGIVGIVAKQSLQENVRRWKRREARREGMKSSSSPTDKRRK